MLRRLVSFSWAPLTNMDYQTYIITQFIQDTRYEMAWDLLLALCVAMICLYHGLFSSTKTMAKLWTFRDDKKLDIYLKLISS